MSTLFEANALKAISSRSLASILGERLAYPTCEQFSVEVTSFVQWNNITSQILSHCIFAVRDSLPILPNPRNFCVPLREGRTNPPRAWQRSILISNSVSALKPSDICFCYHRQRKRKLTKLSKCFHSSMAPATARMGWFTVKPPHTVYSTCVRADAYVCACVCACLCKCLYS